MRHLGLCLLLAACSIDNPLFGLKQETTGATSEQSTSGDPTTTPTTTASPGTSTSTSTSTSGPTSDATTQPASASEPGTTTGESSGSSSSASTTAAESTGGQACSVAAPEPSFDREVHDIAADKGMHVCGIMNPKITGLLKVLNGQIVIHDAGSCANPGKGTALRLGDNFPLIIPDGELGCGIAKILWQPGCLMSAMLVTNANETELLFVGSFTPMPPLLPITPAIVAADICGCGDNPPGCCAPFPDPGIYDLQVPPDPPIAEGEPGMIHANGAPMLLHNLSSRITSECIGADGIGIHVAWVAEFAS